MPKTPSDVRKLLEEGLRKKGTGARRASDIALAVELLTSVNAMRTVADIVETQASGTLAKAGLGKKQVQALLKEITRAAKQARQSGKK